MNNTEAHVIRQLGKLNGLFPSYELTESAIESYVQTLADLDPLDIEAAVTHLISKVRFYPKPSEIRDAVFDLRSAANGYPTPYEAWEQVVDDVWRGVGHPIVGLTREPEAHDLAQRACRQIGGYTVMSQSENPTADRARFIDAYRQIRDRTTELERMLPGVQEHVKLLADKLSVKSLPGGDDGKDKPD
jgi:hypothetical protein